LKQLYEKHLDLSIEESIETDDWSQFFEKLNKRVHEIRAYFPVTLETLQHYCHHKIKSLKSVKFTTAYMLSEHKYSEAFESISSLTTEVKLSSI